MAVAVVFGSGNWEDIKIGDNMKLSAEEIVQRQLDAYNAHDLQAFMATLHPDVEVVSFPESKLVLKGQKKVQDFYGRERFSIRNLRSQVINRIVFGNTVIDHEMISGLVEEKNVEVVVIYQILKGRIGRIWVLKE